MTDNKCLDITRYEIKWHVYKNSRKREYAIFCTYKRRPKINLDPIIKKPKEVNAEKEYTVIKKTLRNQYVIARNKEDGLYYPGVVKSCYSPRFALVMDIATGIEQNIPTRFVIPVKGAVAVPKLQTNDCVVVRVLNLESEIECFVPAVVQFPPCFEQQHPAFYSVTLYNKQKVTTMRKNLVKISQERYNLTLNYLLRIQCNSDPYYRPSNPTPPISEDGDEDKYVNTREEQLLEKESRNQKRKSKHKHKHKRQKAHNNQDWKQESEELKRQLQEKQDQENELKEKSEAHNNQDWKQESEELKRQLQEKQDQENELKQKSEKWREEADILKQQLQQKQDLEKELMKKSEHLDMVNDLKVKLENQEEKRKQWKEKALYLRKQLNEQTKKKQQSDVPEMKDVACSPVPRDEDIIRKESSLFELRKSLPEVKENEEVLAKWSDDCWYYRGTIVENCGNYLYTVKDSIGDVDEIWREDIITDEDDDKNIIQVNDYVVAEYPDYVLSYAPGKVVKVFPNLSMKVCFYDFKESTVFRDQVFKLTEFKYKYDVTGVRQREQTWVGQPAVIRDDQTGVYELANVRKKSSKGQTFTIEWSDGCQVKQDPRHMFGASTRHPPLKEGHYVLAIADNSTNVYLPGQVTSIHADTFDIAFCDGLTKTIPLDKKMYYWLRKEYYNHAVEYFLKKKRQRRLNSS